MATYCCLRRGIVVCPECLYMHCCDQELFPRQNCSFIKGITSVVHDAGNPNQISPLQTKISDISP